MDSNTLQEKSVIVFRKNGSREHWTVAIVNEDRVYYPNETGAETDEVIHSKYYKRRYRIWNKTLWYMF